MATKKNRHPTTPTQQDIIDTTLSLWSKNGIGNVSMNDIIAALNAYPTHVYAHMKTPKDVMGLIITRINHDLAMQYHADDADTSVRDQYFDVIMQRFDLMAPYRADIARMMDAMPGHPTLALRALPHLDRTVTILMRLVHGNDDLKKRPSSAREKLILTWVYLSSLKVWVNDDSADLTKTMAHVDGALARLDGGGLTDIGNTLRGKITDIFDRKTAA